MEKKEIDLIVPCYNTHGTIKRVLYSIATQTSKYKIHVILVDDCSEKPYNYLLEQFKDLEIEIVRLDKNSGPGVARQKGIEAGKSKYIMFMDSDDTLTSSFAVQRLHEFIEQGQYDLVNSNFFEELENGQFLNHVADIIWVFGKMYRREFLEKNNIHFNDTRANEDTGFNAVCFAVGKSGHLNDDTYIWHFNPNSITRRDDGIYRFIGVKGYLFNMEWAVNEIRRIGTPSEIIKKFIYTIYITTYFFYLDLKIWGDERVDFDEFISWVKKFYKVFINEEFDANLFVEVYENVAKQKILTLCKPIDTTLQHYMELTEN